MHQSGKSVRESIMIAGKMRLRPILITTITTVFGLLPLALGFGKGAEFQQPMAIVIVGGISVSTILTLFILPILYKWMMKKDVSL
jgi:HAE1 family hydrophobic/amphiphilic exporter-1